MTEHKIPPLDSFRQDKAWKALDLPKPVHSTIDGVVLQPLTLHRDSRGMLVELITQRDGPQDDVVHVYRVTAEPGSVRAWVYHKWQTDRLAYSEGTFEIVLFDIRPDSPSCGALEVLKLGGDNPMRLSIPAYVVHGVKNVGDSVASFVNMPTQVYDPSDPDKCRMPYPDPRVPYMFEE